MLCSECFQCSSLAIGELAVFFWLCKRKFTVGWVIVKLTYHQNSMLDLMIMMLKLIWKLSLEILKPHLVDLKSEAELPNLGV